MLMANGLVLMELKSEHKYGDSLQESKKLSMTHLMVLMEYYINHQQDQVLGPDTLNKK